MGLDLAPAGSLASVELRPGPPAAARALRRRPRHRARSGGRARPRGGRRRRARLGRVRRAARADLHRGDDGLGVGGAARRAGAGRRSPGRRPAAAGAPDGVGGASRPRSSIWRCAGTVARWSRRSGRATAPVEACAVVGLHADRRRDRRRGRPARRRGLPLGEAQDRAGPRPRPPRRGAGRLPRPRPGRRRQRLVHRRRPVAAGVVRGDRARLPRAADRRRCARRARPPAPGAPVPGRARRVGGLRSPISIGRSPPRPDRS